MATYNTPDVTVSDRRTT